LRRLPQTLIVLALLGATAAAFAVTEQLKLEKSPITGTRVDKVFSPVCECARDLAEISFRLRAAQVVTVDMLDSQGRKVRNLVQNRRERAGRVTYVWDGRDDAGRIVGEGVYRPRVRLRKHGRTIVLPNPIRVDTTTPVIDLVSVAPRVFSPDGDGRNDRVAAEYEIDEPGQAMMLVDGRRRAFSRYRKREGRIVWFGRGVDGRPVRPGTYEIRLRAIDKAGNRSARTRAVDVRVRYVELFPDLVQATAGKPFRIRVMTDAASYRWVFGDRRGRARRKVLVLRAPETPGTYPLYVIVGRWADRAEVSVSAPVEP
jgi:hypothetical protein